MTNSGGLALHGDDVAVAVPVGLHVGVEGDEQVRGHPVFRWRPRFPGDVPFAGHQGGLGVAKVLDQVVDAAAEGEVVEAGHILWLALRRVWELCRALRFGGLGGHVWPLRSGGSGIRTSLGLLMCRFCVSPTSRVFGHAKVVDGPLSVQDGVSGCGECLHDRCCCLVKTRIKTFPGCIEQTQVFQYGLFFP